MSLNQMNIHVEFHNVQMHAQSLALLVTVEFEWLAIHIPESAAHMRGSSYFKFTCSYI
jgi:hypothetical protein